MEPNYRFNIRNTTTGAHFRTTTGDNTAPPPPSLREAIQKHREREKRLAESQTHTQMPSAVWTPVAPPTK